MAKVVKEMPRPRHGSLYDEYLDGKKWQLTQGVDFKSVPHYVRLLLRAACGRPAYMKRWRFLQRKGVVCVGDGAGGGVIGRPGGFWFGLGSR